MPGQPDDAYVVAEVLAAELRADAEVAGQLQHLGLQLQVAEAVAGRRARGGERVEVLAREAYLAVLSAYSAEVPPTTIARWYGGQAAVPISRSFSSRNCIIRVGFSSALVSW